MDSHWESMVFAKPQDLSSSMFIPNVQVCPSMSKYVQVAHNSAAWGIFAVLFVPICFKAFPKDTNSHRLHKGTISSLSPLSQLLRFQKGKKTQNFPNNFRFKKSKSQTCLVGNILKIGKNTHKIHMQISVS